MLELAPPAPVPPATASIRLATGRCMTLRPWAESLPMPASICLSISNWVSAGQPPGGLPRLCRHWIPPGIPHLRCDFPANPSQHETLGARIPRRHRIRERPLRFFWFSFSFSVPAQVSNALSSRLIGPNGEVQRAALPTESGLVLNELDADCVEWRIALLHAKPWRAKARKGEIYPDRYVKGPEVTTRLHFRRSAGVPADWSMKPAARD
jgi:hypothetical protein